MADAITHQSARAIVLDAWRRVFGREATEAEAQGVQAVASLETSYGRGQGVNNWGSIHCPDCSDPNCVPGRDTDASGTAYATCFRSYASPTDGAADLVRTMVRPNVAAALGSGSATSVAYAMHANHYFELAPDAYAARIADRSSAIALALGELVHFRPGPPSDPLKPIVLLGAAAAAAVVFYTERAAARRAYTSLRRQVLLLRG